MNRIIQNAADTVDQKDLALPGVDQPTTAKKLEPFFKEHAERYAKQLLARLVMQAQLEAEWEGA